MEKAPAPRVEKAPAPRVEMEQKEPALAAKHRKIVAYPTVTGYQVAKAAEEAPNYVTDDEEEPPTRPAYSTRAKKQDRTVTQEAMLSTVEMSD